MSKAHINSDIQLAARPVVIDSQTTAHFTYNESLVSDGYPLYPLVNPTSRDISGASNAVVGDDQSYKTTGLIVPGKFANCLAINEATTNVIASQEDLDHHGDVGIEFGLENGIRYFKKDGTSLWWEGVSIPVTNISAGSYYTFSLEILCDIAFSSGFDANEWSSNYTGSSDNTRDSFLEYGTYDTPGEWKRVWMTAHIKSDAASPTIGSTFCYGTHGREADGHKIYYRNWQVEFLPYYTYYTLGTRQNTYLTYPRYPTRTLSLWMKSTSNRTVDGVLTPRTILRQVDINDSYPQWSLSVANTNTTDVIPGTSTAIPAGSAVLKIKWKTDGVNVTSYLCTVPTINLLDEKDHHITCEFGNGSKCRIYVDNLYGETLTIPETNYNFSGLLRVGYDSISDLPGNFLIEELRLDDHLYSSDDIRKRFVSGTENYNPYAYGSYTRGTVGEAIAYTWYEFEELLLEEQEDMTWNQVEGS